MLRPPLGSPETPPMTSNRDDAAPPQPDPKTLDAVIRLLADDQESIVAAARARLLRWGAAALPALRQAAHAGEPAVAVRCRSLLRALQIKDSLARFSRLRLDDAAQAGAAPLLEGSVLLSKLVRTFVPDASDLVAILRWHATELQAKCAGRSLPACARLLAEQLHGAARLRGGRSDAMVMDEVSIDRVLTQQAGSPVTLSLVYLLVARWAGLSAAGVAIPGHFLVRLHGPRPVLVDPFHGGRAVTKLDCARYLRAAGHRPALPHLRDLSDREFLLHYLRALRSAAQKRPVEHALQSLDHAESLLEVG